MLFNSFGFITLFLPVTLIGFFLLGRQSKEAARLWLTACSLLFYGLWSVAYLLLLIGWIAANYLFSRWILSVRETSRKQTQYVLTLSVTLNVLALAYFKYRLFVVEGVSALSGIDFTVQALVLPLAISFHTFQQIAYLVDSSKPGAPRYSFPQYLLFVSFFPQLIAGPIVHHNELLPQFGKKEIFRFDWVSFSAGVLYFIIGLAKKVLIADPLEALHQPVFAPGGAPSQLIDAWIGSLAFGFGLYFDFSGYSDMAVGLARMFGVRLPFNFASPYKSVSIIEFWRTWHITLSRWLRDHLYIPLGGNRLGRTRRYVNLMVTMLVGGLWHGAAWTFVIWGGLHGLFLVVNHVWLKLKSALPGYERYFVIPKWMGIVLTFLSVTVAWVFFASPDFETAMRVLSGMCGANGFSGDAVWNLKQVLLGGPLAVEVPGAFGTRTQILAQYGLPAFAALIVFFAPNSQQIVEGLIGHEQSLRVQSRLRAHWRKTAILAGFAFTLSFLSVGDLKEFVYFQF
ncbi:MBOAT family O-acyltransferase [uncultured Hyphomonas sp.]|jgi:D-alanyl-lipoteichoic acid acyltransferase DltB (MBOAT superfamily)|uniref:MBOAT family O-acyltransferase n=1 Tax=uncultured Hyphomonas sp. TaxID=225298 RepID=UPI000C4B22F5|nr:membrane-bound O-acyltransferase family protein [Hyphomonadaceae bacterium]|tara:strand:+ start:305479 stop:307011 length:1533 start_codon:yes stop_codon:yes gene_type:complete